MKYMLTRFENGREVIVVHGDCSLENMRKMVENSPDLFKHGYVIYEMNAVEYGV
jgi:hypothetical protein